ncbi:MAG: phosphoenolpyruvate synthase [Alphaproteobacteria bacterium]
MATKPHFIRWFEELGIGDVALVGGKNASLGEMYRELVPLGVAVPNGFAVTAEAYRHFVDAAGIDGQIRELLSGIDKRDMADFARRGRLLRETVYGAAVPDDLAVEIAVAYRRLEAAYGGETSVAVRSSATAEDLPTASFAGQHESFLNVAGDAQVLDATKRCFASLFTDRAISYRIDQGFDHLKVLLSVGIQKMVRADLAASGVMFSLDTESGFRDVVFVTGAWGLGETVVQGTVDPDEFYVHKPTFAAGRRCVLRRSLGAKQQKMIYAVGSSRHTTRTLATSEAERDRLCLSDEEVMVLADYAIKCERHYGAKAGEDRPMDMEWAKDGLTGELFLIQARPETVVSQRAAGGFERWELKGTGEVLARGRAIGERVGAGPVRVVRGPRDLERFQPGGVLVADTTTPDWEPVMKNAAAIVTNRGGRTCHAAIVARELGIPAVVGVGDATEVLADDATVTVSCAEGDEGRVYAGSVPFAMETTAVVEGPRPRTHVMVNLGNPELAFRTSFVPNDGVGLARIEFIISEHVRAHPMALLHPERVEDPRERAEIARLTRHHGGDGAAFFVEKLSEGVGTLAAAFWPKPVIVRLSDFKTNEYASLVGGRWFEGSEPNPMLGFRGAARYAHPAYAEGFALECAALARVRGEMGLSNVKAMVPFCRRVDEGEAVVALMAKHGLVRGRDGLEIYVMCEIPNNVIQIDAFARIFDGFSIGSNDLTQLILGVDRDSELVAFDYDERDPGVLETIRLAIEGARRNGRHIGICGQAPSDYPEIAEFLVRHGIDSISLTPDRVVPTTELIRRIEAEA